MQTPAAANQANSALVQPIVSSGTSSGGSHVRRSALPHHALVQNVQCKIHTLHRPTKSLEDMYYSIIAGTSTTNNFDDVLLLQNNDEMSVTATLYGFGIPMHSMDVSSSTRSASRIFTRHRQNLIRGSSNQTATNKLNAMRYPKEIIWDEVLDLPVRWKDLLRDACIAFDVVGPSGEQVI